MGTMTDLVCDNCGAEFQRLASKVKYRKPEKSYCTRDCHQKKNNTAFDVNCNFCGEGVRVRPSQFKKNGGVAYCNKSCSAKFNNKFFDRRQGECSVCNTRIHANKRWCSDCKPKYTFYGWTLLEIKQASKKDYNAYMAVRYHARRNYLASDRPKVCAICGYDKHFEIAHILDLNSPLHNSKTIEEVNSEDNVLALCPNHHWELDHNFL